MTEVTNESILLGYGKRGGETENAAAEMSLSGLTASKGREDTACAGCSAYAVIWPDATVTAEGEVGEIPIGEAAICSSTGCAQIRVLVSERVAGKRLRYGDWPVTVVSGKEDQPLYKIGNVPVKLRGRAPARQ